jgi:hypothetical protein
VRHYVRLFLLVPLPEVFLEVLHIFLVRLWCLEPLNGQISLTLVTLPPDADMYGTLLALRLITLS